MPLIPIEGQPVNLIPELSEGQACNVPNPYCVVYGKGSGEAIMLEMEQTPCASNIISNGTFTDGTNWTADANIVFADNKAQHVVGTSGELRQDLSASLLGSYYQVKVKVRDMSAGTVDIYFTQAGMASKHITENGDYIFYLYDLGDNDNINFVFSADTDASVAEVEVYQLLVETDITAYLLDSGGTPVANFTIIPIDQYLIFRVTTSTLDEGCYSAFVVDPCAVVGALTDVFDDPDFDDAGEWTVTENSPAASVQTIVGPGYGGLFLYDNSGLDPAPTYGRATQAFNLPTGVRLYLEMEVDLLGTGSPLVDVVLFASDSGSDQELLRRDNTDASGAPLGPNGYSLFRTILDANFLSPSNLDIGVMLYENSSGNYSYVRYAQIRYAVLTSENTGIFQSNCLKVQSDVSGLKLIEGFADTVNAYPLGNPSLGFMFLEDFFWLRAYVEASFSAPHNKVPSDVVLYSSGVSKKTVAQRQKQWDLIIGFVDANMHDTLSNIISCDIFTIDGTQFISEDKDNTPDWQKGAVLAESEIEVYRYDKTVFNLNN